MHLIGGQLYPEHNAMVFIFNNLLTWAENVARANKRHQGSYHTFLSVSIRLIQFLDIMVKYFSGI